MLRLARFTLIFVALALLGCRAGGAPATPRPTAPTEATPTTLPTQPPTTRGDGNTLTIFAASSLTDLFADLAGRFEAENPGVTVTINTGASSQLAAQLIEGAPADLFAAANEAQMARVVAAGHIAADAPRHFAANQLALAVPVANPGAILSLADLARPGVRLVAAPADVPIGAYAREAWQKMEASGQFGDDFAARVAANIVSEEANVRQVLSKVVLGEADAAIVYVTDVTPALTEQVYAEPLPPEFNVLASYPLAPLADSPNAALAQRFADFVLSEAGQEIVAKWRFLPVQ